MKKMLSALLSVCLLLTLLPTTVFAADQTAEAGARIVEKSYDESTQILTVDMQIKLPNAVGITSVATMISYDSSKLTLIVEDYTAGEKEQVPTSTRTTLADTCTPATVALKTVNNALYSFIDSALYGTGNRAGLLITLGKSTPGMASHTSQNTTDWLSIYSLRFKVSGPAATTLDSTSLRIADPNLENELVKYTYDNAHTNNYYTVAVVDGQTGLEYYFGKMQDNPDGELSGMKHLMAAAGNNTATYPGSTNPVTPPATKTLNSIAVTTAPTKTTYTAGENFDPTGMVVTATYSDSSTADVTSYTVTDGNNLTAGKTTVTISYTEGSVTETCTQAIVVNAAPPTPTEYTITFNGNGGTPSVGTMSTAGGKLTSLPTATRSGSYSFDGWYTAASGGTQITTAYVFSANTTVYAHWTYNGGGGSYYAPVVPDMPMVYRGCTGDAVKTLQDKLNTLGYNSGNVDGIFGAKTYAAVTAFQKANGLGVDGIVGKLTWGKLYGVSPAMPVETTTVVGRPMVSHGSRGDAVRKLQELLTAMGYDCGSVDGIFGSKTKAAVLAFQKANGLGADGIVGPLTWAKLG